jgi:hypothetical protein
MAIAGGLLLAVSLFSPWYHAENGNATINNRVGPWTGTGWQVHPFLRWPLLVAAVAPLILAYIVIRGHALSWQRGEMTAVVAIFAFGIVAYNAFITRPGNARGLIALRPGVFVAIAGTVLMAFGAAQRTAEGERRRKPPGTI